MSAFPCVAQDTRIDKLSLAKEIAVNFNYDTLKNFSCKETPPGIYALRFKVSKKNKAYDCKFSNDSLLLLKTLFISALNLSLEKCNNLISDREHLQLFYYNNYSSCVYPQDTSAINLNTINKEVAELLSNQLIAIESSIRQLFINEKPQLFVLNPVIINNDNPNQPRPKKGFRNDNQKMNISEMSEDRLTRLIENIKKKREAKNKPVNQ